MKQKCEAKCKLYAPEPGAVGAGLVDGAVANEKLTRGGFELDTSVFRADGRVDVHYTLLAVLHLNLRPEKWIL